MSIVLILAQNVHGQAKNQRICHELTRCPPERVIFNCLRPEGLCLTAGCNLWEKLTDSRDAKCGSRYYLPGEQNAWSVRLTCESKTDEGGYAELGVALPPRST